MAFLSSFRTVALWAAIARSVSNSDSSAGDGAPGRATSLGSASSASRAATSGGTGALVPWNDERPEGADCRVGEQVRARCQPGLVSCQELLASG
jgi:hypothetical protein